MILFVLAVKDRAVGAFNRPIFSPSVGAAVRSFTDEINRDGEDNAMFKHPDDFDLYSLGTFDDNLGHFVAEQDQPVVIVLGKQVKVRS